MNPRTRLVERAIEYGYDGKQWNQAKELDYLDYNQQIDPKVFQPDLPNNVATIDPAKVAFGKPGESKLSDREITMRLASEFFETLVAGDYLALGQLNDVHTATWKTTSVVKWSGCETEISTGIGMFLVPSRERIEKKTNGRTEIQLFSGQKDHSMSLVLAEKTALVAHFKNEPRSETFGNTFLNLRKTIADARRLTDGSVEWLGIQTIDGRRAEGFRIGRGSSETEIWADSKTSLPVRVESVAAVGRDEIRTTMTDFQVNIDLDESAFDLNIPAGYSVQTMEIDCFKPPINYLADALKSAAEHNDGFISA